MYKDKTIGVVVPCYNEELLIIKTIENMPEYVDKVIIVNDGSTDNTLGEINKFISKNSLEIFEIINHKKNKGLGYSIKTGYHRAVEEEIDITVIMAGDNQMNPEYLPELIDQIVSGQADYSKGNRLTHVEYAIMPRFRRFGNSILSLLTKVSTGYWNVIDPQNGYTAISRNALTHVLKGKITNGYGYNSDILTNLNIFNFRVIDVEIPPVYGEADSGIKIGRYIIKTSWILLYGFFRRIHSKYGGLRFHPVLLYYYFSFLFGILSISFFSRMLYIRLYVEDALPPSTTIAALFSFMALIQFLLFALWIDMENSKG